MAFQWNQSVLGQSWPTASQEHQGECRLDAIIAIARPARPRAAPSDLQAWTVEAWRFSGAEAAKASKSKVRFDPPKEEKTMAEVAFMITQKQKRQLIEELGYSEEEVVEIKPEQAHEILRANGRIDE
jgi:hypothetical protein